jgi:hypothetical protein
MGNQSCCAPKQPEDVKETILAPYSSDRPQHENMREVTVNSSLGEELQQPDSSFVASTRPTGSKLTEVGTERCLEMLEAKADSGMEAVRVHYGGMPLDELRAQSSPSIKKNKLFLGELDSDFKRTGYGVFYCEGYLFEGNWELNQLQGSGILVKDNHEVYKGEFVDGRIVEGRLYYPNGSTYEGTFDKHFLKSGQGKETSIDGSVYTGEFLEGLRHGQGELVGKDKSVLKGEFSRGYLAEGSCKSAEGSEYEGQFYKNKMHGTGELRHSNGTFFRGEFSRGYKTEGSLKFADGSEYVGQFYEDKRNGIGKFRNMDGSVYDGAFKDDQMHGDGNLLLPNGQIITGSWSNGALVVQLLVKNPIGWSLIGIK